MTTLILVAIVAAALRFGFKDPSPEVRKLATQFNILGAILAGAVPTVLGHLFGNKQASGDSKRSRQLAEKSLETADTAAKGAVQQYGINSPLRDAFRHGALNFSDPTNPFARNMFGGFSDFLVQESGPDGVGTGYEAPRPQRPASIEAPQLSGRFGEIFNDRLKQQAAAVNNRNASQYAQDAQAWRQRYPYLSRPTGGAGSFFSRLIQKLQQGAQ